MATARARMSQSLAEVFFQGLRERGFVGKAPHLCRLQPGRVDLVSVQFNKYGGSFAVELGRVARGGLQTGPYRDLPVDEINVSHLRTERRRLSQRNSGHPKDDWFVFDADGDEACPRPQAHYDQIAAEALRIFDEKGTPWLLRDDPPETGHEQRSVKPPFFARLFGFK